MAFRLPVIATAVSGIVEIMGDQAPLPGIVAPIANGIAMKVALETFAGRRARSRDLGLRAKERAQAFSLASIGAQVARFRLCAQRYASKEEALMVDQPVSVNRI